MSVCGVLGVRARDGSDSGMGGSQGSVIGSMAQYALHFRHFPGASELFPKPVTLLQQGRAPWSTWEKFPCGSERLTPMCLTDMPVPLITMENTGLLVITTWA